MSGQRKEVTLTELDVIKVTDFNICPHCDARLTYVEDNVKVCNRCDIKIVINKEEGSKIFSNLTLKKRKKKWR